MVVPGATWKRVSNRSTLRIDVPTTVGDRHRKPLVAVLDEEGVIHLEQREWHVDHRGTRCPGADLITKASVPGPEAAVEVGNPAD